MNEIRDLYFNVKTDNNGTKYLLNTAKLIKSNQKKGKPNYD